MMQTKVKIEWDKPKDQDWLSRFNIESALSAYCKNTKFKVTDLEPSYEAEVKEAFELINDIIYRVERGVTLTTKSNSIDRLRNFSNTIKSK